MHSLLQAGANPIIIDMFGRTPMASLRQRHPTYHAAIALLEQVPDAEKTSLLVKVRRLLVVATSGSTITPSCLQSREAQGESLPYVALAPLTDGQHGDEHEEESRKLRTTLAFMCGLEREGMPREVFRVVMDLLMPSWDPLRRGIAGAGQPLPQG